MNELPIRLTLLDIEAEVAGVPPRLTDPGRFTVGSPASASDAVYLSALVSERVADELARRGLVGEREAKKSEPKAEPPRPTFPPGFGRTLERSRALLRESGATLSGHIRYGAARIACEDRDFARRTARTILAALGREDLIDRVVVVAVEELKAGQMGTLFTTDEPILGGVREGQSLIEVYVHRDVYRDPRRLGRVVLHEIGHMIGLGEAGAQKLEQIVFGGR